MGKSTKERHITWNAGLAYAVGLITTDGSLSKDGRHILLTSKDVEQLYNFLKALGRVQSKLGAVRSSYTGGMVPRVQFSDVRLYRFLLAIGLFPNKTKTIGALSVPDDFFFDFLRGHYDGDGTFYSYFDSRWRSSYLYYLVFVSSSPKHIDWLRERIEGLAGVRGHITRDARGPIYQLRYAKREAKIILDRMYREETALCLTRKKLKIQDALGKIDQTL